MTTGVSLSRHEQAIESAKAISRGFSHLSVGLGWVASDPIGNKAVAPSLGLNKAPEGNSSLTSQPMATHSAKAGVWDVQSTEERREGAASDHERLNEVKQGSQYLPSLRRELVENEPENISPPASTSDTSSSEESTLPSPVESLPSPIRRGILASASNQRHHSPSRSKEGSGNKEHLSKSPRIVNWDEETFGDAELHDRPRTWWKYRSSGGRVSPAPFLQPSEDQSPSSSPFPSLYSSLDYVGDVLTAFGFGLGLYVLCDIMGMF